MEYINVLPGRVRFKSNKLYHNKELATFVENYINSLYGVNSGKVSLNTGSVLVKYQADKIHVKRLKENIESVLVAKKIQKYSDEDGINQYQSAIVRKKLAKNKFLLWSAFYLAVKVKSISIGKYSISRNVTVFKVASVVTIIGAYPLLKRIFKGLARYITVDPDKLLEYTALSFTVVRESSKGILLLVLKALDDYIKYSSEVESRKALLDSNNQHYGMAWVRTMDGDEVLVSVDQLEVGSHYFVYPGEMVPTCGKIEKGSAVIDNLYYTGQPLLSRITMGNEIKEGIKVVSGKLEVSVTELPEKQLKSDLKLESLSMFNQVRNFQNRMTLFALSSAAMSYFLFHNILTAFSVMLVLSPKATSVAFTSGINNYLYLLNKNKIYLKHPNTMEQIKNVDKVVFDKTGTLTLGKMEVDSITSFSHYYSKMDIQTIYLNWLHEDKAMTENEEMILIGPKDLMKHFHISIPKAIETRLECEHTLPAYIAINGELVGCVSLKDPVRMHAKEVICRMESMGIDDISMLTGDVQERANEVALETGIRKIYSQKTNKEKAQFIMDAKQEGIVLMVGDGINDILAMKMADVSVSFADNACEKIKLHSDCIIYGNNLLKLSDFIMITQKSYSKIKHTMLLSNLYNFFF